MKPETKGSWEQRCAVLYQVIGGLANRFGVFETSDDVAGALDVACGRGDVEKLLPWPKDMTLGRPGNPALAVGLLSDMVSLLLGSTKPIGPMRDRKDYPPELQNAIDFLHGRVAQPEALSATGHFVEETPGHWKQVSETNPYAIPLYSNTPPERPACGLEEHQRIWVQSRSISAARNYIAALEMELTPTQSPPLAREP